MWPARKVAASRRTMTSEGGRLREIGAQGGAPTAAAQARLVRSPIRAPPSTRRVLTCLGWKALDGCAERRSAEPERHPAWQPESRLQANELIAHLRGHAT
jgi:hypothetical protein